MTEQKNDEKAEKSEQKSDRVKVRILTASALVNTEDDSRAGLYDVVEVDRDRADYLCGIGAAAPVDDDGVAAKAPAGGATATSDAEAARVKAEHDAAVERQEATERQEQARRRPVTKPAPKASK